MYRHRRFAVKVDSVDTTSAFPPHTVFDMGDEENAAAAAPPFIAYFNSNLRLPPELNLTNVFENFKTWKRQVEIY